MIPTMAFWGAHYSFVVEIYEKATAECIQT